MQDYMHHLISRTGYLFLFGFFLLWNCDSDLSFLQPPIDGPSVEERLQTAYSQNSQEDFAGLIQNWHLVSIPRLTADIADSVIRDVHEIFIQFFNPFHLGELAPGFSSTFWDSIYVETNYLIVDNELVFTQYDTASLDIYTALWECPIARRDTLANFRPQVEYKGNKILYAYDEYMEAIYHFLGDNTKPENFAECRRQQSFLNSYLRVIWPRWGGWAIQTLPDVETISLNKTLDTAIVNWFRWDLGGKAVMQKIDGTWTFIESEVTWMTQ